MRQVLRWGRSAYESDADLQLEAEGARALGLRWRAHPDRSPPDLAEIDALVVTSGVRVDADVLERFRGSLVLTTTSGWDHIDLEAARARGVTVARLPEARRDAVVAHALGAMILLLRRFPALQGAAEAGHWARGDLPALAPTGLDRATILLVGLGVIGRRMAEVLRPLGCTLLGVDPAGVPPGVEAVELDEGLRRADAVSLHCALTPTSRGLLDDRALGLLAPHAVVVNTARGAILDVEAAVARVADGRLRGVHVDVFPKEPWPRLAEGAAVEGVFFTPHAAGYVADLGQRVAQGVVAALGAWSRGEPVPWSL